MSTTSHGYTRRPPSTSYNSRSADLRYEPGGLSFAVRIEKNIATDKLAFALTKRVFNYYIEAFTRMKTLYATSSRSNSLSERRFRKYLSKIISIRERAVKELVSKAFNQIKRNSNFFDVMQDCESLNESFLFKFLALLAQKKTLQRPITRDSLLSKILARIKLQQIVKNRVVEDMSRRVKRNLYEAFVKIHFISSLNTFKEVQDGIFELNESTINYNMLGLARSLERIVHKNLRGNVSMFRDMRTQKINPFQQPSYRLLDEFVTKLYKVITARFARFVRATPNATKGLLKSEGHLFEQIALAKAWKKLKMHSEKSGKIQQKYEVACIKIAQQVSQAMRRTYSLAFREFDIFEEVVLINRSAGQRFDTNYQETRSHDGSKRYLVGFCAISVFVKSTERKLVAYGWRLLNEFAQSQALEKLEEENFTNKMNALLTIVQRCAVRVSYRNFALATSFEALNNYRRNIAAMNVSTTEPNPLRAVYKLSRVLHTKVAARLAFGFYRICSPEKTIQSTYIQKVSEKNFTAQINKNMIFNMSVVNSRLEEKIKKRAAMIQQQNAKIKLAKILFNNNEREDIQWAFTTWQNNISFPHNKYNQFKHFNEVLEKENNILLDEINQIQEAQKEAQEQPEINISESYTKTSMVGGLVSPTVQKLANLKLDFDKELRDSLINRSFHMESEESENALSHCEFFEKQNVELLELIQQTEEELDLETQQYEAQLSELLNTINEPIMKNSRVSKKNKLHIPLRKYS